MTAMDRRADKRTTVALKIKLKYPDLDSFVERYSRNISKSGIFITSKKPKPEGTTIRFELLLADGSRALRGIGTVKWVKPYDPENPRAPHGMGVRFTKLDKESKELVARMVEAKETAKAAKQPKESKQDVLRPEEKAPQQAPPRSEQPEAEQPQAEQPQAEQPQDEQPQAEQPETEQPETEQPQDEQPETEQPQNEQPEAEQPEAEQPETEQPQDEQPQDEQPQDEQPETEQPQDEQPETEQPQDEQPEAEQPEAERPEAEQPQDEQPEAEQPEAERPEAEQPQDEQPEAEQPEAERPEAEQPQDEQPQDEQQDEQTDHAGQPSSADSDLADILGDAGDDLVASALKRIKASNLLDDQDLDALLQDDQAPREQPASDERNDKDTNQAQTATESPAEAPTPAAEEESAFDGEWTGRVDAQWDDVSANPVGTDADSESQDADISAQSAEEDHEAEPATGPESVQEDFAPADNESIDVTEPDFHSEVVTDTQTQTQPIEPDSNQVDVPQRESDVAPAPPAPASETSVSQDASVLEEDLEDALESLAPAASPEATESSQGPVSALKGGLPTFEEPENNDDWPDMTLPDMANPQAPAPHPEGEPSQEHPTAPVVDEQSQPIPADPMAAESDPDEPRNAAIPTDRGDVETASEQVADEDERLPSDEVVVLDAEENLDSLLVEEAPLDPLEELDYRGEPIVPKPPTPPPLRKDSSIDDFDDLSKEHSGRVLEPPAVADPGTGSEPERRDLGLGDDDGAVESDLSAAFENIRTDVRSMVPDSASHQPRPTEPGLDGSEDFVEQGTGDQEAVPEKEVSDSQASQSSSIGFVWELGELPQVERQVDVPQFDFDWDAKTNPNAGSGKQADDHPPVARVEGPAAPSGPRDGAADSLSDLEIEPAEKLAELDASHRAQPKTPPAQDSGQAANTENNEEPQKDEDETDDLDEKKKKKKGLFKRLFGK